MILVASSAACHARPKKELYQGRVAFIHRAAESSYSRKPVFSLAHPYSIGPGQSGASHPDHRDGRGILLHAGIDIHSNPKNLRHQEVRWFILRGQGLGYRTGDRRPSRGILVALRELQYYLVSCIPAQFYLFGARRRRDSYLLGLLRLFLRLFLPKLSAIRVARFNSPRSYGPKKNRCSHERRSAGS